MARRNYGQFCGLAHAVDLVGERWALLILRDLFVGPRRFTDLKRGLPRIPSNILSSRLKELEGSGVVQRTVLPRPDGSVVYELTDYGRDLEDIVIGLGRWGARTLGEPGPDDVVTEDILVMAMRTTFQPEQAEGVHVGFELHAGEIVVHARIDDGHLETAGGPLEGADLTLSAGPVLKALMARELTPAEAVGNGSVQIEGDPALLELYVQLFRIGSPAEAYSPV